MVAAFTLRLVRRTVPARALLAVVAVLALSWLVSLLLPLLASLAALLAAAQAPAMAAGNALFAQLGLTVGAGIGLRKAMGVTQRGAWVAEQLRRRLNQVVLWVTLPALVFRSVHGAPLEADIVQAPLAAVAGMAGTAALAWLLLERRYGRTPATGGLVLAASAGSVSFLGIPVARELFGAEQARVAVYFAVLNVPLALLSAAIISRRIGCASEPAAAEGRSAALVAGFLVHVGRQFLSLPATWALMAGLALGGVALPAAADRALTLLAATVAPAVMFALGLGLRFESTLAPYRMALPAAAIKLVVSPLVVFVCARAIGLTGLPLAIVSLQGAMPTQVLGVVVAERFRLDSRLVGLTLAIDTLLAFLLLPLLAGALHATVAGPAG